MSPKPAEPRFGLGRSLLFSLILVSAFFALLEGALRITGVPRPVRTGLLLRLLDTDITFPFMRADRETFWAPIPGYRGEFLGQAVSINASGLRGPELPPVKPLGRRRLLTFGDSITFGYGVSDVETYAARLGSLAGPRGVDVLNAGVTGFTSHQLLAHLQRVVPAVKADYVTICIGWNDATRRPGTDRDYASHLSRSMAIEGLLDRLYLYKALRNLYSRAAYRRLAAAGWTVPRVPPEQYRQNLERAIRFCRERGVRVALLALPRRKQAGDKPPDPTYPALARSVAHESEVPLLEIGSLAYETPLPTNQDLFIDSLHFSPEGHDALAQVLLPQLERLKWL